MFHNKTSPRIRMSVWMSVPAVAVLAAAFAVAVPSGAQGGRGAEAGIQAVRALTARYQDEAAAIADGFTPTPVCVPNMGYHYVNYSRLDTRLEPSRPEALLFAPAPGGGRLLVGAEWIVVDADQDLTTDDDRPAMFGHDFEGPMPGHEPGMPIHYDLHAYAWVGNPAGAFAPWNTSVICP